VNWWYRVALPFFLCQLVSDDKRKASGLMVVGGGVAINCSGGHGGLGFCWNCYGKLP